MKPTNKQFILNDIKNNESDFDINDINEIKKALKRIVYQKMLNKKYTDYDTINEFYEEVL